MPCDYSKYPKNWETEIRPAILERATRFCEHIGKARPCFEVCGVENGAIIIREGDTFEYNPDYVTANKRGFGFYVTTGFTKVVLTIAHIDHDTTNNDPQNLKVLCQRCHLRHDACLHRQNARDTMNRRRGLIDLFE